MGDDLGARILESLEEKPRSISEIARELDEEKYQVAKRIEVLEEQGYINTHKVGRSTACILADGVDLEAFRAEHGSREPDVEEAESREEPVDEPDGDGAAGDEPDDTGSERSDPVPVPHPQNGEGPRTIGIVSGKGGVGKTVVTLNLGAAMLDLGEDVIVMDADAEMPNLGIQLGLYTYPTSLSQVVEEDVHIMSAMHVDKDSGIRVLPTSLSAEPMEADVGAAIDMLPDDYTVLIDSPPGYERPVERVIETCDELIFVTTPEIPALADTYKLYTEARERGKTPLGVVVNMYSSPKHHLSVAEVEEALEMPVLGVVEKSNLVPRSILDNQPAVSMKPYAKVSRAFKKIASDLTGREYEESVLDRIRGVLP